MSITNPADCEVYSVIYDFELETNIRPAEIHRHLVEVCWKGVMNEGNVYKWCRCRLFIEGRIHVHYDSYTRKSTVTTEYLKNPYSWQAWHNHKNICFYWIYYPGATINADVYCAIVLKLRRTIENLTSDVSLLHHIAPLPHWYRLYWISLVGKSLMPPPPPRLDLLYFFAKLKKLKNKSMAIRKKSIVD